MGQYYRAVLETEKEKISFRSYDFDNGAKLMEHSYIGNSFVRRVEIELLNSPKRLTWAGDYADPIKGSITLKRGKMDNIKAFYNYYELIPIGTKGYINVCGTIYAVRLSRRILQRNTNPYWVDLYNVWETPTGDEYAIKTGTKSTRINGDWISVAATIEGAKRNEYGDFPFEKFSLHNIFTMKYGIRSGKNINLNKIYGFKMVNGLPKWYQLTYNMEVDGNGLCITIPDFENGIAFVSEEECRKHATYEVVEFEERNETLEEIKDIREKSEKLAERLEPIIDKHYYCADKINRLCFDGITQILDEIERKEKFNLQ